MTKHDFIVKAQAHMADEEGNVPSQAKISEYVDAIMQTINEVVAEGETIRFDPVGTFTIKERKAKNGVNPKTKEKLVIPAKTVPRFTPSKALKEAVAK